ncbi:MAG TPA: hypothetical protein VN081_04230 [Dongiaceae bacterium]|nr:hypothetical protein [Dongiaceae bacterium]
MNNQDAGRHFTKQVADITAPQSHGKLSRRHGSRKLWWIISIVIVILVAGSVVCFLWQNSSQVDSNRYQAVFLSNGQVYFGKLHGYEGSRPYLTNVYYIQAPNTASATGTSSTDTSNQNQQLVKLGSEIHGPDDEIILNKSSILFVENLSNDGKVVKLIQSGTTGTNTGTQK